MVELSPRATPGDAVGAAPLFDLSAELADQASVNTLQGTNRVLLMLGLRGLFDRAVKQPQEEIKNITMQVPLSKSFLKKQHAAGAAPRKTNAVFTAKYSIWTFVPMASLYQFRRFTNAFYLAIAVIAIVGYYGNNLWVVSYDPVTIIILLAVVVGVALLFEGKDDWARHVNDRATNRHKTQRVRNGKVEQTTWGDLIPGDLIFVDDRESAPADFVLIASFGADKNGSLCYIETSSIDGETNLKIKEAPEHLTHLLSEGAGAAQKGVSRSASMKLRREASSRLQLDTKKEQLARVITPMVAGLYEFEQPNSFLQFNGAFTPVKQPGTKHGIFFKNLILRGSQVRNTKYVLGMVVYSGPETKLALSKKKAPAKLSQIDKFMNRILLFVFIFYLILTVIADLVLMLAVPDTVTWWYFAYTSSVNSFNVPGWLAFFFTFLVLFANIIPIPIIICVEVMNFYAQYVCNNDLEMYHAETNKRANMAAAGLAAEVGQITHIFSDKTGTLTRNEMKLVGCFVNGARYGYIPPTVDMDGGQEQPQESPSSLKASGPHDVEQGVGAAAAAAAAEKDDAASQESMRSIDIEEVFRPVIEMLRDSAFGNGPERDAVWQFFLMLAVCHTVVVDFDDKGQLTYNAESPDEDAFVRCAAQLGFVLTGTGDGGITIKTPLGDERKYKVLAINPFNSTRKRMSLVVQDLATGEVQCMAKGADNVMLERLAPGQEHLVAPLNAALVQYSWNGLRTLVMGSRVLSEPEFREWDAENKASKVKPPSERMEAIAASAEKIERGMRFIGASAIEDQLQLGVPEAIKTLREAGTQVWVLTGDKVETAINIGLSCNLIDPQMLQVKLVSEDLEVLDQQLRAICAVIDTVEMKVDVMMEARADAIDKVEASSSNRTGGDAKPPMERFAFSNEDLEQLKVLIDKRDAAAPAGGFVDDEVSADLCPKLSLKGGCSNLCARFSAWAKDVRSFAVTINPRTDDVQVEAALIVSGSSLQKLLKAQAGDAELEKRLLRVARFCKVVLACRVSPAQKSLIVEMVRYAEDNQYRKLLPVTLAIGDGANDVPMIQSAHLGVGISGHEGTQAVNSADFSIAQFRFLVRLMLVHGRWNYRRQAKVILFVIYTWILYTLLLFFYLPYSLWSGQQVFYFLSYISVFAYFANVTIITHGWFSRDISAECALSHPWTYGHSVLGKDLKGVKLVICVWRAILHGFLIWAITVLTLPTEVSVDVLGTAVYNGIVCVIFIMSATAGDTQTAVTGLVFLIMIAAYLGLVGTTTTPNYIFSPPDVANVIWANTILVIFAVVVVDMAILHLKKEYWPSTLEVLVEQDRGYYMGDKYGRSARKDAINVMKELGKLTVVPLTLGAKNVGKLVTAAPEGHDASELHAEEGTNGSPRMGPRSGTGGSSGSGGGSAAPDAGTGAAAGAPGTPDAKKKNRLFGASSAIGRFTPQFNLDIPTLGDVQRGFEVGLDKVTLGRVKIGEAAQREAVRDFEEEMISYQASANRMNIAELTSVMPGIADVAEEDEETTSPDSSAASLPSAGASQRDTTRPDDLVV